ncbi:MAG: hypothetical protein U0Z44_06690 [Kouleothrix sp.]
MCCSWPADRRARGRSDRPRRAPPLAPIAAGVDAGYGRYLATIGGCADRHGQSFAGGPVPGAPLECRWLDLTPAGEISGWADADFITTMRTGINPAGKALDSFMPYRYIGRLTDDELRAIYLYLKTLPAMPIGAR